MNCRMTGLAILHYLLEFAQLMFIESVMPSNHPIFCCPLSSGLQYFWASGSFPKRLLFTSGEKRIELQLQHQSFQWIFRVDFLWVTSLISLMFKGPSSPTPQFKGTNSSMVSFLYCATPTSIQDYWKNHSFDYMDLDSKVMSLLFYYTV